MAGGRNDGKHNFVMFNEGDMKIVDKARFFRTRSGDAYGFTLKILIWNKELNTQAFYPNPSNLHQYNKM